MIRRIVLIVLLVVGLSAASYVLGQRARVESRNRAVEIVLDYQEIEQVAASTGSTAGQVLRRFARAGATSVAVAEQTLGDAIDAREVMPYSERQFAVSPQVAARITGRLRMALPALHDGIKCTQLPDTPYAFLTIDQKLPMTYLELLPVGLPEEAIQAAKNAGLQVVARLTNYPGATPRAIGELLADTKRRGMSKVIFSADQVLGFKGAVRDTARAFRRNGLLYGRVEFAKQKGDQELAERAAGSVIVVHSIAANEMPLLDERAIVERFARGVKERGVRMCYVRMYDTASADLVKSNARYIAAIASAIRAAGCRLKPAHPFDQVDVPLALRIAAGAGVAGGAMLLLTAFVDLSVVSWVVWTVAALAVCAGLAGMGDMGRKAVALLAAVVFPTLGAIEATHNVPESPRYAPAALMGAFGRLFGAVVTAGLGGLLIVGLLSERTFMLRIDQFIGVKLAHLLPILILGLAYAGGVAWQSGPWQAQKRTFIRRIKEIGLDPMLAWQAAAIVAALGLVVFMVARSGNEPGMDVSAWELRFRAVLDKLFLVRPRTKEFLIGYPALVVGLAFALRGRRAWAAPFVVIGAIGLVSALNTFCHIHTPLVVSGLRLANGLVLGALVGIVAYAILRNLPGKEKG